MFYEQICLERDKIISKINNLTSVLEELPEGKLICTKNGNHTKWYHSDGKNFTYLHKRNKVLAEKLAIKKYYEYQLKELSQELTLIEKYLDKHHKIKIKSEDLLKESSYYKELLKANLLTSDEKLLQWSKQSYIPNPNHTENLIHQCLAGHKVRSKSEVIIANSLFLHKIPYRYEAGINLESSMIFPDFTICHPKTLQIIYWEHFGLMDNSTYRDNVYHKLGIYGRHNIIPTINLITTYEMRDYPLNSSKIETIIQENFL